MTTQVVIPSGDHSDGRTSVFPLPSPSLHAESGACIDTPQLMTGFCSDDLVSWIQCLVHASSGDVFLNFIFTVMAIYNQCPCLKP